MPKQFISKAIGIDLGTTNSVVAIMNPTDMDILIHRDSGSKRETMPSCVWMDPRSREIVVGRKARSRVGTSPSPIRSIKRKMGRQERVSLLNDLVSPEEVSAHILREMKQQIKEDVAIFSTSTTSWLVDRAIITVPAYFSQPQIEATRKAAEMAGLQVLELLHEPTAAACYHCWRTHTQNGIFLVYDLGGGTFDVSVLRCTSGVFEVLGISGNNFLGGDDIDTILAKHLLEQLQKQNSHLDLDLENDEEDRLRFEKLKLLTEGVKIALSTRDEYLLRDITGFKDKKDQWVEIESQFERSEFEELIHPVVMRTIPYCFEALDQAKEKADVTLADIDAIILAGGSTHIPFVRELVRQTFCASPDAQEPRAKCTEPIYEKVDTIVALGAAIRAAAVGGLAIYNPEQAVRVSFRGMGATSSKMAHIGGLVESLDPKVDLAGGFVRLTIPELAFGDESDLSESGTFGFTHVSLQPEAENLMHFEVYDRYGTLQASVDRAVIQDKKAQNLDDEGTAVLSKSLSLDVMEAGGVHRRELIKAPQTLPISAKFEFIHPGNTEQIRFSLYQSGQKIKEVFVEVPLTLPRGEIIHLKVQVDKLTNITCSGTIGESQFQFTVEPAEDYSITASDIAERCERFKQLLPEQRNAVKQEWEYAERAAEDAIKSGDSAKAVGEIERMDDLLLKVAPTKPLDPPKEEFDKLVRECLEYNQLANQAAVRARKPHDARAMESAIEEQRRKGEMAFRADDQKAYAEAYNMLKNNLYKHMIHVIMAMAGKPMLSLDEQAGRALLYMKEKIAEVKSLAEKKGRSDLRSQLVQISAEVNSLELCMQRDPDAVLTKSAQLLAEIERIDNVLKGTNSGSTDIPINFKK